MPAASSRAASHALRRAVLGAIAARITRLGITQAEAGAILGISQPRVSALLHGRSEVFSLDTLVDLAARLGLRVRIEVLRPYRSRRTASTRP